MKVRDIIVESYDARPIPGTKDMSGDPENIQRAVEYIRENCQPWLDKWDGSFPVWRGTNAPQDAELFVRSIRKERTPADSSSLMHELFNHWISMAGGLANRSNSAFVTGSLETASQYGADYYVVMPLGDFHYTWSPELRDWYESLGGNLGNRLHYRWMDARRVLAWVQEHQPEQWEQYVAQHPGVDTVEAFIEEFERLPARTAEGMRVDSYETSLYDPQKIRQVITADLFLNRAIRQGSEIMIAARGMVYIGQEIHEKLISQLRQGSSS